MYVSVCVYKDSVNKFGDGQFLALCYNQTNDRIDEKLTVINVDCM